MKTYKELLGDVGSILNGQLGVKDFSANSVTKDVGFIWRKL